MRRYRVRAAGGVKDNGRLITPAERCELERISGLIVEGLRIDIVAFCCSDPTFLRHNDRHWICAGQLQFREGFRLFDLDQVRPTIVTVLVGNIHKLAAYEFGH